MKTTGGMVKKMDRVARYYGIESQLRQLAEESAELAQASLKAIREDYSEESLAHIIEEIADVQVMMIQIQCLEGINYARIVEKMIEKTDRQIERIKAEGGKLPY